MKFADIIECAGINPKLFPNLALIPTKYYGRKNCKLQESPKVNKPVFYNRPDSLIRFIKFLNEREKSNDFSEVIVKIEDSVLCVYYKGHNPALFMRAK